MISRWITVTGFLGLLIVAGCGGSAGERGAAGPAVGEGVGATGGAIPSEPSGKEADTAETDQNAGPGVIQSELGYPVQDQRLGEHAGY